MTDKAEGKKGGGSQVDSEATDTELTEVQKAKLAHEKKVAKRLLRRQRIAAINEISKKMHTAAQKSILSISQKKPTQDLYGQMYRRTTWLVMYSYQASNKFPKRHKQRVGIDNDLIADANNILERVIRLCVFNPLIDEVEREKELRELSVKLKAMNVLIRVAYDQNFIGDRQVTNWTQYVTDVDNYAIGLAMWYQHKREKAAKGEKETAEVKEKKNEKPTIKS